MAFILSSIVMGLVLLGILIEEWRCAKRAKQLMYENDLAIDDLGERALLSYREVYGRDPTLETPILRDKKARPK